MLTLNQIIAQIKAVAASHAQLASSGVGTLAEWQANPDRLYPLLWVFHERTDVSDQYFTYRIRLIAADRVKVGESGEDDTGHEQEVLSDMQSVLLDFIAWFAQQHTQAYIVERTGTIEPFTERGNDRVAGCSYTINIKQPWDFAKCSVPSSGAVVPPSVDGLTLYDFCDASVIARLTPQQVACLQAEYGTACDPVTVEINGTEVGTPASGDTFPINVTLDGTPSGAWDGVDTWEVTSDPCANAAYALQNTVPTTIGSGSIPSGGSANITAPDAQAVLKDTANNTLSTTAIPSNVSANITAPDGSYSQRDSAGNVITTGNIRAGQTGVIIVAPDGSYSLRDTASNVLATGNIRSNQTGVVITAPDGTYSLRDTSGTVLGTGSIRSGQLSVVITAPDGTVTLNGGAYGVVKSGGTLNVNSNTYSRLPSKTWLWAFADRALITGYTGNLLQYITGGGSTFTAGQDANGYVDVASVVANRGADTAFTRTLYDQVGGAVNLLDVSAGTRPRYAVPSATDFGHTNIFQPSNVGQMNAAISLSLNSTVTVYMVVMPVSTSGAMIASSGSAWWLEYSGTNSFYMYDGTIYSASANCLQPFAFQLITIQLKQNALVVRVNGTQVLSSGTWSRAATTSFTIGARVGGSNPSTQGWRACVAHSGDLDTTVEAALISAYDL
jgi:hypothetical protein